MGKAPLELRTVIAVNIRACRQKMFPGRGGGKRCAEAFGVSPQQWSPWERGAHTPHEMRLAQIADFFGVSVDYLRQDHSRTDSNTDGESAVSADTSQTNNKDHSRNSAGILPAASNFPYCPFYRPPKPGQPLSENVRSLCWLAERFFCDIREHGITFRLHPDDIERIFERSDKRYSPPQ